MKNIRKTRKIKYTTAIRYLNFNSYLGIAFFESFLSDEHAYRVKCTRASRRLLSTESLFNNNSQHRRHATCRVSLARERIGSC